MAECKELWETKRQRLQEVASAEVDEKVEEMILSSVQSLAPSLNSGNLNPTQIVMGRNNTTLSGCNVNITNIYGRDNGNPQKSEVMEVDSPCLSPTRNKEPSRLASEGMSSLPSAKGTKSNQMILRVVPLATEIQDCDDDLILVVWFCWDDDQTFQKILKSEHNNGNVTLDSYDTIVIQRPNSNRCTIPVHLKTNEDYTWEPLVKSKWIQSNQLWNADRAKCSFRIQKNPEHPESDLLYLTLVIKENDDPAGTQFIVKKKVLDIKMPREDQRELFKHLDANTSVRRQVKSNFVQSQDDGLGFQRGSLDERSLACWAIPYIDRLFSTEDDVVLTLWLCWYDKKGELLEGLKGEQKLYGREALDTENSLILENPEEKIEAILKHNGYYSQSDNQKAIDANRIVQGTRAKFQFISKRIEDDYDYAARIVATIGKCDPGAIEKEVKMTERSRGIPVDNQLMPKLKPNRLDVEIAAWQGDRVPIEFTKVTEVTQFVCGVKNMTSRNGIFSRLKSHIKSGYHKYVTKNTVHGAPHSLNWKDEILRSQGQLGRGYTPRLRGDGSTQKPQKIVLRLHIFVSQDTNSKALNIHLVLVTMDFLKSLQNLQQLAHDEWVAVDSYDTFLLTSQLGEESDPPVEVTYQAHRTSNWHPDSDRMSVEVNEILKDGIWRCNCRFSKKADSQNKDLFFSIVRVTQIGSSSNQSSCIHVKKKMKDIETLIKEASNSALEQKSPVCLPDNAGSAVVLDEHKTCLAVVFVEPMQNKADGILLNVWICSIQQTQDDFHILCDEQKKFMKKQLDTENSFVFFDMKSPVHASVEISDLSSSRNELKQSPFFSRPIFHEPLDQMFHRQEIHPQRILEGGRAKFQFILERSRTYNDFNKLLVKVTIHQTVWNAVQFMTRKEVEFFWKDDALSNIQDTGTD